MKLKTVLLILIVGLRSLAASQSEAPHAALVRLVESPDATPEQIKSAAMEACRELKRMETEIAILRQEAAGLRGQLHSARVAMDRMEAEKRGTGEAQGSVHQLAWTPILRQSGTSPTTSQRFTVPRNWRVQWLCRSTGNSSVFIADASGQRPQPIAWVNNDSEQGITYGLEAGEYQITIGASGCSWEFQVEVAN